MVSRTYTIRTIEGEDRVKNERMIQSAKRRGDLEDAESYDKAFRQWENEQGEEREMLVCAVCGDRWLKPTTSGRARPHRQSGRDQPSWDKVRQLGIESLQAEVHRPLEALEP